MSIKIVKTTNDGVNFLATISEQIIVDSIEAVKTFNRAQECFSELDKAYTDELASMQQTIANINADGSKKSEEQKTKEIAEENEKYMALKDKPIEFEISSELCDFLIKEILRVVSETKLQGADRMGIKGVGLIRDTEKAIDQLLAAEDK